MAIGRDDADHAPAHPLRSSLGSPPVPVRTAAWERADQRFACQIGAEVADADFVPSDYFNTPKSVKSNDRATHFAVAASKLALEDARLDVGALPDATRIGVIVGSAFGGMGTFEEQTLKLESGGTRKVSPFTIPALLGNTHAGVVAIEIGAKVTIERKHARGVVS